MIASSFLARAASSSPVACRRGARARWTPSGVGATIAGKHSAEGVVLSSVGMWSSIWMRSTRGRPVGSGRILG